MKYYPKAYWIFCLALFTQQCKPSDARSVRINNVMCRTKPDINSKVVQIFNKGTILRTKPTDIRFTFINVTDVWHEVPNLKCFTFGGLLEAAPTDANQDTKTWFIQELHKDQNGVESSDWVSLRPEPLTKRDCELIVAKDEAERERKGAEFRKWFKEKEADCARQGITSLAECGLPFEGGPETILSCVQK
jgi:hypothetical protein